MEDAIDVLVEGHKESHDRRLAEAERESRHTAQNRGDVRNIQGLGRLKYEIPEAAAKEWFAKEGRNVLRDPDFINYQRRKNPHLFSQNGQRKNRVGYGD